jgi:hypothetical protein
VPWRAFGLALILAALPGLLSTYAGAQLLAGAGLALGVVAGAFPPASIRPVRVLSSAPVAQAATSARGAPAMRADECRP